MNKKEALESLIRKAERSLNVARDLFDDKNFDFSISRAYYSMFYCTEALLFTMDMSFSKHSAVISAFGREFVKRGIFPAEFHSYLSDAFEKRIKSDYEVAVFPSKKECGDILDNAESFLKQTKKYIKEFNSKSKKR